MVAKLTNELIHQGFIQSKNDYSPFVKCSATSITIVAVYVDDIILTGDDLSCIQKLKPYLPQAFNIKDHGHLTFFLGMEVTYVSDDIMLIQGRFASDMVTDSGLHSPEQVVTPLLVHLKLQSGNSPLYSKPTL